MAAALTLMRRPDNNFGTNGDQIQKLTSRHQQLLSAWYLWSVELQELADYILPRKNSIIVQRIPGSKRTQKMFDSTAPDAAYKLANSIHGGMTSSYLRWLFLETDDEDLNRDQQTLIWLERVALMMYSEYNKSNFASEFHESYIDDITFGTSVIYQEAKPIRQTGIFEGLRFRCEPAGRYVLAEGADGLVNTIFRSLPLTRGAIAKEWGDVPKDILDVEAKPDELEEVIHAVLPKGNEWESTYYLSKQKHVLKESRYYEFPFACTRWSKYAGEVYGTGPSHPQLPNIRSLNKIKELELRACAKAIDPPMGALAGDIVGPVRVVPGGVTTMRTQNGMWPLYGNAINFSVSNLKSAELVAAIRDGYHLNEIQFQEGPQMTATEVNARMEMMQRLLGPALGREESEKIKPTVDRTFNLMNRANVFPPIPPAMQNALRQKKIVLRLRHEGPFARAQKAADVAAIQQLATMAEPLMQLDPSSADAIDFAEGLRLSGRRLGVPATMIRDDAAVADVRKQRADQQAQLQQQEAAQQTAAAVPNLLKAGGKRPEPGSPLEGMMNGQAQ